MKIQNAEMNFVMFDTEDVIVTSGPWLGQSLAAQIKTIAEYNATYEIKLKSVYGSTKGVDGTSAHPDYWLKYYPDKDSDGLLKAEKIADRTQPTDRPYFIADTAEKIKQWLDLYTSNQ